jgi:hypothetical protein
MAKEHSPGVANFGSKVKRKPSPKRKQPRALGGPSDQKTPVAESGAQPAPQGPRRARQPGGQATLPTDPRATR